jgi:hypothetical protein
MQEVRTDLLIHDHSLRFRLERGVLDFEAEAMLAQILIYILPRIPHTLMRGEERTLQDDSATQCKQVASTKDRMHFYTTAVEGLILVIPRIALVGGDHLGRSLVGSVHLRRQNGPAGKVDCVPERNRPQRKGDRGGEVVPFWGLASSKFE